MSTPAKALPVQLLAARAEALFTSDLSVRREYTRTEVATAIRHAIGTHDGIMGPQTIAAIKDLQRDAHLPQTGQMNAATQAALANFLAHGNNQMGG